MSKTTAGKLPGKFVWFELHTKDIEAAQGFYGEVIGWKTEGMTMPDGTNYPFIKTGDSPIGGYQALRGPHPHFLSYVSVEDVDASAAKVEQHGGQLLMKPFDAPTVGRISIVQDPQGAVLGLFHSESADPSDDEGVHGGFHWNELWSSDVKASLDFYTKALGYKAESAVMESTDDKASNADAPREYFVLSSGGVPRAGMMQVPDKSIPSMWLPYVQVDDPDAIVNRVKKMKGEIKFAPVETATVGLHGVLADPQGAVLGFIKPAARA